MSQNDDNNPLNSLFQQFLRFEQSEELIKQNKIEEACALLQEMVDFDPLDLTGAKLKLAYYKKCTTPDQAPPDHIKWLFNRMSASFDEKLLEVLRYTAPETVRGMIDAHKLGPFARMLDLGCGTGLAAKALQDITGHRDGVDIAAKMLQQASEKKLYDSLSCAEITEFLSRAHQDSWDLISMLDVLPYNGALDLFFSGVVHHLTLRGIFIFSIETQSSEFLEGAPYRVGQYRRYAHAEDYTRTLIDQHGLEVIEATNTILRYEHKHPIAGKIYLTRLSKT